jgi:hypothetical protein
MMTDAALQMVAGVDLEQRASHVALLAFRCARHAEEKRDIACAEALKAYLDVNPNKQNASDEVVAVLVDALRARPHWVN